MKHLKRLCILTLALVLCCAVGLLLARTLPVGAATVVDSGYCGGEGDGTNLTWTLDSDGLLTISGTGAMGSCNRSYSSSDGTYYTTAPWGGSVANAQRVKTVVIEPGVTSIGDFAFYGCTGLTSVTIPDSVTSIGDCAFSDCTGLTSVTIPDSVTSIGYYAFDGCTGLTGVYITDLAAWCRIPFADYYAQPLIYAQNLYINGVLAETVTIPDGVTSIGNSTFSGCRSLTSVTIPDSVTSIGNYAFYDCTGLVSVTIPDSVTSIGYSAFYNCSSLTSVTIPDSVTSIGNSAFYGCSSLTSVTIGNGVTSIGSDAFYNCPSLTGVYINDFAAWCRISFADYYAQPLNYAHNLYINGVLAETVTIPDSMTSIGSYAFYGCTASITIPDSVTSIGNNAFGDYIHILCNRNSCAHTYAQEHNLAFGLLDGTEEENTFSGSYGKMSWTIDRVHCVLTVNCEGNMPYFSSYSNVPWYSLRNYVHSAVFSDDLTSIGSYAFSGCTSLISVTIPDSVTSIGNSAFYGCSSLTSVTIGNGVTSIGNSTFSGCTRLKGVYITDLAAWCGISFANDYAQPLNYAHNLYINGELAETVTIPDSVTSIGSYAFRGCRSLTSVTIPDSVTSIGSYAFNGCTSLTGVYITDLAAWCRISFANSYAQPLYFAYNLYINGELAETVTIPDGVTSIGSSAFYGCTGLTSVTIPDSVTSIGGSAFKDCTSLTSIELPYSVNTVYDSAFKGCSTMESIYFYSRNCSIYSGAIPVNATIYGYGGSTAETYANNNGLIFKEITNHTHTPKLSGAYAPTCGVPGFTGNTICAMCGEVLTPGQEIPATGDHTPGEATEQTVQEPTCGRPGEKRITVACTVCGNTLSDETVEIPATGEHTFGAWTVTKPATATEEGEETRSCAVCGATETRAIPKTETPENPDHPDNPDNPDDPTPPAVTAENIGDVDHDGKITASDARLALRAAVGLETFDEETADLADADRDGKITASDARLILRAAVGLEDRKDWLAA